MAILKVEEAEDEDEFKPLEIKVKIQQYRKDFPNEKKLSSELMSEAFRWRLSQNDCQNRGYILDGYPISYQTACEVFIVQPTPPEKPQPKINEDGEEEEPAEEIDEEELANLMKPKF